METVVPKDSRYTPLTQQKWCCVPTCIQMVMLKHKIPLQPAELIGYHMGLVVPKNDKKYFYNVRTGPKPPAGYGTQAGKQYNPNAVFKKLKIPLKMSWQLINKFSDLDQFRKYLGKVESSGKDTLICYDWYALFLSGVKQRNGHVCVLDKVYLDKNIVRIIDPDWEAPRWREIKITALYKAMQIHGVGNCAGFWEITTTYSSGSTFRV